MIYATTDRLHLRQLTRQDLSLLVELIGNWNVAQWLVRVPHPYTMADAENWLAQQQAHYDLKQPEFFVIAENVSNHLIGGIGLHAPSYEIDFPAKEFGYWLGEAYWGQGIMSEAVATILKIGFMQQKNENLFATTDPANARSRHVLHKAGFTETGCVPRMAKAQRGSEHMNIWRLSRKDYENSLGKISKLSNP